MNYEQKYKESLERAKKWHNAPNADKIPTLSTRIIEEIFPELRESEDERIRKECISIINAWDKTCRLQGDYCEVASSCIAWLEKQGEQKSIWHNEDEEPQRDSLILLIMQSGTPIVAKVVEPNHTFNHGERWAYIDDLFERQGENTLIEEIKRRKELLISAKEKRNIIKYKIISWRQNCNA